MATCVPPDVARLRPPDVIWMGRLQLGHRMFVSVHKFVGSSGYPSSAKMATSGHSGNLKIADLDINELEEAIWSMSGGMAVGALAGTPLGPVRMAVGAVAGIAPAPQFKRYSAEGDLSHEGSSGHAPQHSILIHSPLSSVSTGPPHPLEFSKDMSYERLAEWLTNTVVGDDYQQDISKLRDERIDGCTFRDLDESALRQFGVSYGFQHKLLDIIENLTKKQEDHDGVGDHEVVPQQLTLAKCSVCLNIHVDPCTLSCGHTFCLLCLARMWNSNKKICPVCKEPWRVFPAISYDYRRNIESAHGREVERLRNEYSQEDKELIKKVLEAKRNSSMRSESLTQELKGQLSVQTLVDAYPQPLTFSKHMGNQQLAVWLRNHPSLSGTDYEEDISKLIDARINGHVFLNLNESRLTQFGISLGFKFAVMGIIDDILQKSSHQPPSSDRLPLQQQPPRSSVATSRTTQHQLSSSTAGQQTKLEPVPQPLEFSKDMSYEQLAVWLTNHPQFVGADYQQDISKLKDAKINGRAFLSLTESRLERSGVSLGFQCTLIDIIETLKNIDQGRDSEGLPPQLDSTSSTLANLTIRQFPISESAPGQQNQTKLDELPTLDELLILKYTDEGKRHKLRITKEASHKWMDIANLICGDVNVTNILKEKCGGDPNECLRQTFIGYFINKKPQGYTHDWNGLIELLDDVDLETVAEKVKHALLCGR